MPATLTTSTVVAGPALSESAVSSQPNKPGSSFGQTRSRLTFSNSTIGANKDKEFPSSQLTLTNSTSIDHSAAANSQKDELAALLQKKRELEQRRDELDGLIVFEVDKNKNMSDVSGLVDPRSSEERLIRIIPFDRAWKLKS